MTLVPVAAILVASIRLHFLDVLLQPQVSRAERHRLRCAVPQRRGDRLVSSTARRSSYSRRMASALCDDVREGATNPHGAAADAATVMAMRGQAIVRGRAASPTSSGILFISGAWSGRRSAGFLLATRRPPRALKMRASAVSHLAKA